MANDVEIVDIKDFVNEVNRRGGGEYKLGFSEDGAYVISSLRATIRFERAQLVYNDWLGKSLLLDSKTPGIENGRIGISHPVAVEHIKSRIYRNAFVIITKEEDRHTVFLNYLESDRKRGRPKK